MIPGMVSPWLLVDLVVDKEVEVHGVDLDPMLKSLLSAQVCASFAENQFGGSLLVNRWRDMMMELECYGYEEY